MPEAGQLASVVDNGTQETVGLQPAPSSLKDSHVSPLLAPLPMKALSMMQPYAWLFANGVLTVDDRLWSTTHRGPLAIHASRGFHRAYYDWFQENSRQLLPPPSAFEHGGIVGVARLVDCLPRREGPALIRDELTLKRSHFGAPGHYGLVLEGAASAPFVAARGNVRLFEVPDALLALSANAGA